MCVCVITRIVNMKMAIYTNYKIKNNVVELLLRFVELKITFFLQIKLNDTSVCVTCTHAHKITSNPFDVIPVDTDKIFFFFDVLLSSLLTLIQFFHFKQKRMADV